MSDYDGHGSADAYVPCQDFTAWHYEGWHYVTNWAWSCRCGRESEDGLTLSTLADALADAAKAHAPATHDHRWLLLVQYVDGRRLDFCPDCGVRRQVQRVH